MDNLPILQGRCPKRVGLMGENSEFGSGEGPGVKMRNFGGGKGRNRDKSREIERGQSQ